MKTTLLGWIFFCAAAVPVMAEGFDFIGTYKLIIDGQNGWQNNGIEIKGMTAKSANGILTIDWNLGPEGRAPLAWEKTHEIPFKAAVTGTKTITFTVDVAGKASYAFILYPVRGGDGLQYLSGSVTITTGKTKTVSGVIGIAP